MLPFKFTFLGTGIVICDRTTQRNQAWAEMERDLGIIWDGYLDENINPACSSGEKSKCRGRD